MLILTRNILDLLNWYISFFFYIYVHYIEISLYCNVLLLKCCFPHWCCSDAGCNSNALAWCLSDNSEAVLLKEGFPDVTTFELLAILEAYWLAHNTPELTSWLDIFANCQQARHTLWQPSRHVQAFVVKRIWTECIAVQRTVSERKLHSWRKICPAPSIKPGTSDLPGKSP